MDVDGVAVVVHRAEGIGGGDVRTLALDVRGRLDRAGRRRRRRGRSTARSPWSPRSTTRAAVAGVSANELVRTVGGLIGGRGGGKDDVAQGGGADATRLDEALGLVPGEVARMTGQG